MLCGDSTDGSIYNKQVILKRPSFPSSAGVAFESTKATNRRERRISIVRPIDSVYLDSLIQQRILGRYKTNHYPSSPNPISTFSRTPVATGSTATMQKRGNVTSEIELKNSLHFRRIHSTTHDICADCANGRSREESLHRHFAIGIRLVF